MNQTYQEVRKKAPKKRDTWIRRIACDPIAIPLTYLLTRYTNVTPLGLTVSAFLLGMVAATWFALSHILVGAVYYYGHFLLDGMDGKLSRIRGEEDTYRGMWDFVLDGIVCVTVVIGLGIGSGDRLLTLVLLVWTSLHFLEMRFSSTIYHLMAQKRISSSRLVNEDMEELYTRKTGGLIQWTVRLYHRLAYRMEEVGLNTIPTVGEAAFLLFIVGPILWNLTDNIEWMYIASVIGMVFMLPGILGQLVIAYILAKEDK
jgi:phosphatidylglycerophosphate synthase